MPAFLSQQPPNPTTPLAWLPADLGLQLEASQYLTIPTLSAWLWDLLLSTSEEYRTLCTRKFGLVQSVYIVSRLSCLASLVTTAAYLVADIDDCGALLTASGAALAVTVSATSFLMLVRVRAVFADKRPVVYVFMALWVATTVSGCVTAPLALTGVHLGPTKRCIVTEVKNSGSVGIVILAVNDSLVFLAITYRLLFYHLVSESWSTRARSFLRGESLGKAAQLLLRTGQLYYLATVGMNILTVASLLAPAFPAGPHAMFFPPDIALTNSMACRVFRQVRLGLLSEDTLPPLSSVKWAAPLQLPTTTLERTGVHSGSNKERGQDTEKVIDGGGDCTQDRELETRSPPLKPAAL